MRSRATWFVVAAVGVVIFAGVVDAVRRSGSQQESAAAGRVTLTIAGSAMTESLRAASAPPTSEPAVTTQPAAGTAALPADQSAAPERLPSCAVAQLRLAFAVEEGMAGALLRRVQGQPCHHGRAGIGFTVRDESGGRVAVFGGNTRATPPADFSNGFEQFLDIDSLSCDPRGSFLVVATVGPYVVRRTLPGAELPCNHG